jgi:hypothetical protein
MATRLKRLGIVLAVLGFGFIAASGYAYFKTQEGYRSLDAFSSAQNVKLSYNDQGQLVDRGDPAGGQAIMNLLTQDWGFPVVAAEMNPNDPVVNTPSEYMYQMATISEHTLSSTVTLPADIKDADGNIVAHAGDTIPVNGRYYSEFNFANPVDQAVRGLAWSPLALSLIGQLGVGAVTATSLQMGFAMVGMLLAVGFGFELAGFGLVWVARPEKVKVPATKTVPAPIPA